MRLTVVGDVLLEQDPGDPSGEPDPGGPPGEPTAGAPPSGTEPGSRRSRAGGAGLIATMLRDDGHEVELLTALSDDEGAVRLREHLAGIRIIACASRAPTPLVTRPRAGSRESQRIPEPGERPPLPRVTSRMLAAVARARALIVADRGRRLLEHPELRVAVHRRGSDVPLVWDPRIPGADPVPSCRLVTPSLLDAATAAGTPAHPSAAAEAAERLQHRYGCCAIAITLGAQGALLVEQDREPLLVRSTPVDPVDTRDAGCRFVATAATVLARGGDRREAVRSGVAAARAYLAAGGVRDPDAAHARHPSGREPQPDTDLPVPSAAQPPLSRSRAHRSSTLR
ncbi:PfkB family carbohydrate kinase [Leucobacter sp.]